MPAGGTRFPRLWSAVKELKQSHHQGYWRSYPPFYNHLNHGVIIEIDEENVKNFLLFCKFEALQKIISDEQNHRTF